MKLVYRERLVFLLPLLFHLHLLPLQAQVELGDQRREGPNFRVDYVSFKSEGTGLSNLLFLYKIGYSELQFIKREDGFLASYEISPILYDRKGRQVSGQIWRDSLKVKTYEETRLKERFLTGQKSFFVNPDTYKIQVKLVDLHTQQSSQEVREVEVPSFGEPGWALSDLVLANSVNISGDHSTFKRGEYGIVPNVGGIFEDQEPDLFLYFEIYGLPQGRLVEEIYQIRDRNGRILASDSLKVEVKGHPFSTVHQFSLRDLEPGRYEVEVESKAFSYGEKKVKREFQMYWRDTAPSAEDYHTAVEQLRYIATSQEMKRLKECPPKKRRELLREFWKRRDPTPETSRNELREEYYRRVEFSNVNFKAMVDGWRSDRGRIYIIYGRPDEVERHPFETETVSYQIWYYYEKKLKFIFVDRHGFGDYELVSPLYPGYR